MTYPTDRAVEYIKASVVPVREGRKCVDGRYLPNQAKGLIARPGGDSGYVMALIAVNRKKKLGLTAQECLCAVYNAVTKHKGKFYLHTDHKCDPDNHSHHGLIGCGHLAKAATMQGCRKYDVTSKDIKTLVYHVRFLCNVSSDIEMVNLDGDHKEEGVLIVRSQKYTILADNPSLSEMYFVYDQDRDVDFMRKLVRTMNIPGITYGDMKQESDLQLHQTLQNLASGLPIYEVSFTAHGEPVVAFTSTVPKSSFPSKLQFFKGFHHFFPQNLIKFARG
jgi:hypothetical protein